MISKHLILLVTLFFSLQLFSQERTDNLESWDGEEAEIKETNPYLQEGFQRILKVAVIDFPNKFSNIKGSSRPSNNTSSGNSSSKFYDTMAQFPTALDTYIVNNEFHATLFKTTTKSEAILTYWNLKKAIQVADLHCGDLIFKDGKADKRGTYGRKTAFIPANRSETYKNLMIGISLSEDTNPSEKVAGEPQYVVRIMVKNISATPKVSYDTLNAISKSAAQETERLKGEEAKILNEYKDVITKQLNDMGLTVDEFKFYSLDDNNSNMPIELPRGNMYLINAYRMTEPFKEETKLSLKMETIMSDIIVYGESKTRKMTQKIEYVVISKSEDSHLIVDFRTMKHDEKFVLDVFGKDKNSKGDVIVAISYLSLENKASDHRDNKPKDYYETTPAGKKALQKALLKK